MSERTSSAEPDVGKNSSDESIEAIRQRLSARRADLVTRHERVQHDLTRRNEPLVADFSDQAIQRQNEEALGVIAASASDEIAAIDAALQRLAHGRYGVCSQCGADIEAARLEAVPHAVRCAHCAEQAEQRS